MARSIEEMHGLERAWLRDRACSTVVLDERAHAIYGYALRLSTLKRIQNHHGEWIDVSPALESFRADLWNLLIQMAAEAPGFSNEAWYGTGILAWMGKWHRTTILDGTARVGQLLYQALQNLYRQFPDELDEYLIEAVLRQKRLVLSLGGGGGTGYVHLCLFQWLEEIGIRPSLITGTSIGSLIGFVRSIQENYDAASITLQLPGLWRLTRHLQPSFHMGVHGLFGVWNLDFNHLMQGLLQGLGLASEPMFRELKIPFGCVATGIVQQGNIAETVEGQQGSGTLLSRIKRFSWRHALRHGIQIASLVTKAHATREIVFGFDDLTSTMPVLDAIAFSSLVPGLLHYEVPHNHYRSREILDTIFKRENLYRLADGGMVSNVPVRAARRAIESGRYGHGNVYILGIDVFAPQPMDILFYPLEQIANANAVVDAQYADSFVRLRDLLSSVNLAPTLAQLRWLNSRFRKAFEDEMKIIQYAMKPLKSLSHLDLASL